MNESLIFLIGLLVSAFGNLVGFGGGVFMVPILIIFFGYPIDLAIGAVMVSLLPAALLSSFFNYREKKIDYLVATLIQFPAVAGTVLGAFLVKFLPVLELQFCFAFFVISVGSYMLATRKSSEANERHSGMMYRIRRMPTSFIRKNRHQQIAYRLNGGIVAAFGMFSGVISGLFGVGGGFLQTPVMVRLFRMPAAIATSTSVFILIITSLTGSVSHYFLGHVSWTRTLPVLVAFSLGALFGHFSKRKTKPSRQQYEILIGAALFLAGFAVILNIAIKTKLFS